MSVTKAEFAPLSRLRREAEVRLKEGSAPTTAGWSVGVNALTLLHELASQPASAVDALKLLHELQVHQVELDLQHEQIETSHRDLVNDMSYYRGLFECAPVAYLNLNPQRDILECNIAAAKLFGAEQEKLRGRSIDGFLAPGSRTDLAHLMKRLRPDGASESCEVQLKAAPGSKRFQVLASTNSVDESILIVLVELSERR